MLITPSRAISDPNLLGRGFQGSSWNRWKATLRAAYGEALTDEERALFYEVAERDPPNRPVRELWCVIGRRGGKDSVAAAIAVTAAIQDYSAFLRAGEVASVVCLAVDRHQARIVFRYIKGAFQSNRLLAPLILSETRHELHLSNNVEVTVVTNSFRAIRGRTVVCAIFDEVAYWRDEAGANPDSEVYNALVPALATLPNSMLIGITTAYRRAGLAFDKWRQSYGQNDPDILVVKATSRQFNPLLPERIITQALERDPEAAAAEWLSEWRSDINDFVSREVVESAVVPGQYELPYFHEHFYSGFVDPSGGSSDSFTLAIAHSEGDRAILDCVREVRPPFSPDEVTTEFANTLKRYQITEVVGDRYGGEFPRELFAKNGINYAPSEHTASDIYRELLPLLNARRIALLDHSRLVSQICSLERRAARSGKDSISHPPGSHDDLANAAAGALVLVGGGDAKWREIVRSLIPDNVPIPTMPF